jgi:hypothetical protein
MQTALERKRVRRKQRSKWKQRLRRKGIFREGMDVRQSRLRRKRWKREWAETYRMLQLQRDMEALARARATAGVAELVEAAR